MATKYDPNGLYEALAPIRRTRNCVQGQPKNAAGFVYIKPDEDEEPVLFTMADRTPAQIQMLVEEKKVIRPVAKQEAKK